MFQTLRSLIVFIINMKFIIKHVYLKEDKNKLDKESLRLLFHLSPIYFPLYICIGIRTISVILHFIMIAFCIRFIKTESIFRNVESVRMRIWIAERRNRIMYRTAKTRDITLRKIVMIGFLRIFLFRLLQFQIRVFVV